MDLEELDGFYDTGDNCFGCFNAEEFVDLNDKKNIGITAGASSPEVLITEVISSLKDILKNVKIIQVEGVTENITFKPLESFT